MKGKANRRSRASVGIKEEDMSRLSPAAFSKLVRQVDPSDLGSDFARWPELAREAWRLSDIPHTNGLDPSTLSTIIVTGMGGSGIVGELIADICEEADSRTQVIVLKNYHLPSWMKNDAVRKETLVVGVSCSGNTEETLYVLNESARAGLKGFAFGSGGELEKFCQRHAEFVFTKTGALKVPRSPLPALFYPVLKFFISSGIVRLSDADVQESFHSLSTMKQGCQNLESGAKNKVLELANQMSKTSRLGIPITPLIYSSRRTRAVGMRFQQSLNENAKLHGFDGQIPELCHNDIVGWDSSAASTTVNSPLIARGIPHGTKSKNAKRNNGINNALPVLLRLEDDPVEIKTRFEIVEDVIRGTGVTPIYAAYSGSSYLARVMSMLYSLDYSTYYTAILRRVDPIKTDSIGFLKAELKNRLDYLHRFK